MTIVHQLDTLLAQPEAPARATGRPVIGMLGAAAPAELIEAAGAAPLRLRGDPGRGTEHADTWMEQVQDGWLRTVFDRLLPGDLGWLSAIVVPRSSEQLLQFYHLVEHVRIAEPDRALPPLILFDLLQTPADRSTRYVRARMEEVRTALAQLTRTTPTDEDIAAAIARRNANRARYTALSDTRHGSGPALTGSDALRLAVAGQVLPSDAFAELLAETDSLLQDTAGPQLMLSGSAAADPAYLSAIEAAGGRVVAEDHDWGARLYDTPVPETPDPLDGLTAHYRQNVPTPRLPVDAEEARFANVAANLKPDGVIFALEENDDTEGWEIPRRRRVLDGLGIPSLVLTGRSYFAPDADPEGRIAAFLSQLAEATS